MSAKMIGTTVGVGLGLAVGFGGGWLVRGLSAPAAAPTTTAATAEGHLGTVSGIHVMRESISDVHRRRLFDGELQGWQAREDVLREIFLEGWFARYAKEKGLSGAAEARPAYVAEVGKVTDGEIDAMLERFKGNPQLEAMPAEEQRNAVRQVLEGQVEQGVLRRLIDEGQRGGEILSTIPRPNEPRIQVAEAGNPAQGPEGAPVTIIEFADYQCPACARMVPSLKAALARFEGKVRWVFRDFPLNFHPEAFPAAIAASCAGQQGKYFEAHGFLFDNISNLGEEIYASVPTELKLDVEKYIACRQDPEIRAEVEADLHEGVRLGVPGTPTYFINGRQVGPMDEDSFSRIIEEELARG